MGKKTISAVGSLIGRFQSMITLKGQSNSNRKNFGYTACFSSCQFFTIVSSSVSAHFVRQKKISTRSRSPSRLSLPPSSLTLIMLLTQRFPLSASGPRYRVAHDRDRSQDATPDSSSPGTFFLRNRDWHGSNLVRALIGERLTGHAFACSRVEHRFSNANGALSGSV
jgi:hypothetical protein